MSADPNEQEKVFEWYSYLPPENRMMIVDKMDSKARCLFGGSSRLSWKEAKMSKNAIYGLEVLDYFNVREDMPISVFFSEKIEKAGFRLVFKTRNGNRMEYLDLNWTKRWEIELDNSVDVTQPAIAHFKYLLKMYQNRIKCLRIQKNYDELRGIGNEIESLKNLEKLYVGTCLSNIDIGPFLPKVRRQLKCLKAYGIENCRILAEWEQTYRVSDKLTLYDSNLNYEQFLRISARDVKVDIGQLTEQDFFNFVKSWHNRTYTGGIEACSWFWISTFDVNTLLRLFEEFDWADVRRNGTVYIQQNDSEDVAKLYTRNRLRFIIQRYEVERGDVYEDDDMDYEELDEEEEYNIERDGVYDDDNMDGEELDEENENEDMDDSEDLEEE